MTVSLVRRPALDEGGTLPIAEVARRTGLSADTLRYYEKAGLIDSVHRTAGNSALRRRRHGVAGIPRPSTRHRQVNRRRRMTETERYEPGFEVVVTDQVFAGRSLLPVDTDSHVQGDNAFPL